MFLIKYKNMVHFIVKYFLKTKCFWRDPVKPVVLVETGYNVFISCRIVTLSGVFLLDVLYSDCRRSNEQLEMKAPLFICVDNLIISQLRTIKYHPPKNDGFLVGWYLGHYVFIKCSHFRNCVTKKADILPYTALCGT